MIKKEEISSLLNKLRDYKGNSSEDDLNANKASFCIEVLERFEQNYDEWIDSCPFSIQTVSRYLSDKYIGINGIRDELYLSCARFLREYVFSIERKGNRDSWIGGDWSAFVRNADNMIMNDHKPWLDYLKNREVDIDIINNYLGDRSYQAFLNYEKRSQEAEKNLKTIESNVDQKTSFIENFLSSKQNEVKQLAEILEKQKTAFNFVGLSKGFENLLEKKNYSKCWTFIFLILTGMALLVTPLGYLYSLFHLPDLIQSTELWKQIIPFIGLEIIFLYFFRVILNHYNSIQTQIMQLELRQSLCQFIQNYADYAKEMKEKDGASLEKFENLIFSSILSTPDKVPSTFDGLDQLANIVKEIRKS